MVSVPFGCNFWWEPPLASASNIRQSGWLLDLLLLFHYFVILFWSFHVYIDRSRTEWRMRWTICQLLAFVFRKIYPFPQINSQLPVISLFLIKVDRGLTIPPLSSFIKEERRGCVWSLPLVLTCPAFKMAGGFKRSASPSPWVMEVCPPLSRALAPRGQTIKWRNFPPAPIPLYQGLNPSDFIKQSSGELEL